MRIYPHLSLSLTSHFGFAKIRCEFIFFGLRRGSAWYCVFRGLALSLTSHFGFSKIRGEFIFGIVFLGVVRLAVIAEPSWSFSWEKKRSAQLFLSMMNGVSCLSSFRAMKQLLLHHHSALFSPVSPLITELVKHIFRLVNIFLAQLFLFY